MIIFVVGVSSLWLKYFQCGSIISLLVIMQSLPLSLSLSLSLSSASLSLSLSLEQVLLFATALCQLNDSGCRLKRKTPICYLHQSPPTQTYPLPASISLLLSCYMHTRTHIHTHAHTRVRAHAHTHTHTHTRIYIYIWWIRNHRKRYGSWKETRALDLFLAVRVHLYGDICLK